jgi:hypothetical protein
MFKHLKQLISVLFVWALLVLTISACEGPSISPYATLSSCVKPVMDSSQLASNFLPLAIGNKWVYQKTISQDVFAWEAYQVKGEKIVTFAVGTPPNMPSGTSQETYLIIDTINENGLQYWELQVSDSKARDGRYGSWYTKPDRILWGRVPSSEHLVEIDEVMTTRTGFFTDEKRHEGVLLLEPLQSGVKATIQQVGLDEVQVTALPELANVETPAGKFPCSFEMITEVKTDQYQWTTYSYYAPGVGLVKEVQKDDKGNVTYVMELTGYELK